MKPFSPDSPLGRKIMGIIQHYNHDKYWKRRKVLIDPQNNVGIIKKLYYLFYIKRADAYHNCSFGTNLNNGARFQSPPILPHGPNGIIIEHDVTIGKNCTIYQQVTITHGGVRDR